MRGVTAAAILVLRHIDRGLYAEVLHHRSNLVPEAPPDCIQKIGGPRPARRDPSAFVSTSGQGNLEIDSGLHETRLKNRERRLRKGCPTYGTHQKYRP